MNHQVEIAGINSLQAKSESAIKGCNPVVVLFGMQNDGTIIAAVPHVVAPAADQEQTNKKTLPLSLQRCPEAGFHHVHYVFHGRE
jgi:hypothetical protein